MVILSSTSLTKTTLMTTWQPPMRGTSDRCASFSGWQRDTSSHAPPVRSASLHGRQRDRSMEKAKAQSIIKIISRPVVFVTVKAAEAEEVCFDDRRERMDAHQEMVRADRLWNWWSAARLSESFEETLSCRETPALATGTKEPGTGHGSSGHRCEAGPASSNRPSAKRTNASPGSTGRSDEARSASSDRRSVIAR